MSAVGPDSITAPANSSVTRSQICATTPRSWVTKMTAVPMRLLHDANKSQDLFLHRDVERGCRFVGDDDLGLERESRGDQDALAHAARQLVRIGAQHALRVSDMHFGEQFERAFVRLARIHAAAQPQAVRQLRLDAPAGVERGHRVLGHERDGVAEDRARLAPRQRS